jgi:hypothetical protein
LTFSTRRETMSDVSERTCITPEARASYPHLFVARPGLDGEPKFSCVFIFEEGTDLTAVKRIILAAAEEKWPGKAKAMFKSGQLRNPLRSDWEEKGYPENSVFLTASSKKQPGVVAPWPGEDGRPEPITDPNKVYPGSYIRGSIRAYAYDVRGNKGVTFNLNNVQFLRDGERLDSSVDARDEFEAIAERETADLSPAEASEVDDLLGLGG